jgi:hypothetical protein
MMTIDQNGQFDLEEAIRVLKATPAVLKSLLQNLPAAWLDFSEEPEAWNPRTVLVHYIHNEQTNWMPRLSVILSDAEVRRFPPFQQLPELNDYEAMTIPQLLTMFAELRQKNLSELRNLDLGPADFSREAEHPVLGTVNLRQLLATWVVHDLNHQYQIVKSMSKRYQDEVGPWLPNLAILEL